MTRHPLTQAFDELAAFAERGRAAKAHARAIIEEHEAQETDPMNERTSPPHAYVGQVVQYRQRDNPSDPKTPVTFPPYAALVLAVHDDGRTVDLLVFGQGSRADHARGKGLVRFRGDVRYHDDVLDDGGREIEARWWTSAGPETKPPQSVALS